MAPETYPTAGGSTKNETGGETELAESPLGRYWKRVWELVAYVFLVDLDFTFWSYCELWTPQIDLIVMGKQIWSKKCFLWVRYSESFPEKFGIGMEIRDTKPLFSTISRDNGYATSSSSLTSPKLIPSVPYFELCRGSSVLLDQNNRFNEHFLNN